MKVMIINLEETAFYGATDFQGMVPSRLRPGQNSAHAPDSAPRIDLV